MHIRRFLQATMLFGLFIIPIVTSATGLDFRPYCSELTENDSPFGEIPSIEYVVDYSSENCTSFGAADPQTLSTNPLAVGDVLDIDLVITNDDIDTIKRFTATLTFDPSIVAITDVTIDQGFFSDIAPGGADVNDDGTVTIDISNEAGIEAKTIRAATITVELLTATNSKLAYTLNKTGVYNATESTAEDTIDTETPTLRIQAKAASDSSAANAQNDELGDDNLGLEDDFSFEDELDAELEAIAEDETTTAEPVVTSSESSSSSSNSSSTSSSEQSVSSSTPSSSSAKSVETVVQKQLGETCSENDECISDTCVDSICRATNNTLGIGDSCVVDFQCTSGICSNGACAASQESSQSSISSQIQTNSNISSTPAINNAAFPLLQIRNVQVTTEDSNVYLAWDELGSSQLKGYNIYFSTVSEQYIQRKTIPATERTLTLRNLPKGVTHYFAVRGVSNADEETAFSNEVSVVVGKPDSSSSPLIAAVLTTSGSTIVAKVVDDSTGEVLLGETGAPSIAMLAFVLIAGVCTSIVVGNRFAVEA